MPLDFPVSPVEGQVYDTYIYSSGKWSAQGSTNNVGTQIAQLQTASPIAVASAGARDSLYPAPTQGNSVFRTDTGSTEIYYGSAWRVISQALPQQVLQVVPFTTAASVSSSSTSYADTNLTATITPTSASSKVLIIVAQDVLKAAGNPNTAMDLRLFRGATAVHTTINIGYTGGTGANYLGQVPLIHWDTPATTSATTYKTQFRNIAAAASVFVQAGGPSTILLIEVSA